MDEPLRLGRDGPDKSRMTVTKIIYCKAPKKIQIFPSFMVPYTTSLPSHEGNGKAGVGGGVISVSLPDKERAFTGQSLTPGEVELPWGVLPLLFSKKSLCQSPPA